MGILTKHVRSIVLLLGAISFTIVYGSNLSNVTITEQDNDIVSENLRPAKIGNRHEILISSNVTKSDIKPTVSNDGGALTYRLYHEKATYISVHFTKMNLSHGCQIELFGPNETQNDHYILTHKGFHNLETFWARHVKGDLLVIMLNCTGISVKESNSMFEINNYVSGFSSDHTIHERKLIKKENGKILHREMSLCGRDDKRNAICYTFSHPRHYNSARAVARLYIHGSYTCSGFLVSHSPSLILTNEHCIRNQEDVDNTDFEFMGEEPYCGATSGNCNLCDRGVIFDGKILLKVNPEKDYALIELERDPALYYGYLDLDNRPALHNERIYVPQHPNGRAKEIAVTDTSTVDGTCRILGRKQACSSGAKYRDISYNCDTEGGSSGSPVISTDTHKVIALHHCGSGRHCTGNQGVPITNIYHEIKGFITHTKMPTPTSSPSKSQSSSCVRSESLLTVRIVTDAFPKETSWGLVYGSGSQLAGQVFLEGKGVDMKREYSIERCIPSDCYDFTIYDMYSDGICCNFGFGFYTIKFNDVRVGQGSKFDEKEMTSFGKCSPLSRAPEKKESDLISFNSFEFPDNWGIFIKGGENARRHRGLDAHSGEASLAIKDNRNIISSVFTKPIDVFLYRTLIISFYYSTLNFKEDDVFFLEYSANGGISWEINISWVYQRNSTNENEWNNDKILLNMEEINTVSVRFRCSAQPHGIAYIDDVEIRGISGVVKEISFNDFEKPDDWGIFQKNGMVSGRHEGNITHSGKASLVILSHPRKSSSVFTSEIDISSYTSLRIEFWYYTLQFIKADDFSFEYSTDSGYSWIRARQWIRNRDFTNKMWYQDKVTLDTKMIKSISIRFICDARIRHERMYIDDVKISGV